MPCLTTTATACHSLLSGIVALAMALMTTPIALGAQTASNVKCNRCVDETDLKKNVVTRTTLGKKSVGSKQLAKGAVTGSRIERGAVTFGKLDPALLAPLGNVVQVAKTGPFTDPIEAMESITDASKHNPYLLRIAPGWYYLNRTLQMKPWVDIEGSGREQTTLWGRGHLYDPGMSTGLVQGANHAEIRNLTIKNENASSASYCPGGSCIRVATLYNLNVSPTITDVRIYAVGDNLVGLYNQGTASPRISHTEVIVWKPGSIAILNSGSFLQDETSTPRLIHVTAHSTDAEAIVNQYNRPLLMNVVAWGSNDTISNISSAPVLMNVTATATSQPGTTIDNTGDSDALLMNVTVKNSWKDLSDGIGIDGSSRILHSNIGDRSYPPSKYFPVGGPSLIGNTMLEGLAPVGTKCFNAFNINLEPVTCD